MFPQQKDGGPNGTVTCHLLSRGSLPEPAIMGAFQVLWFY